MDRRRGHTMTTPRECAELVQLALAGRKDAFVWLVELYQNVVYGLAYQNAPNPSDAEDIAQEAFLRAYRDLRKLRKPDRFGQWVCGIAVNVAREKTRARRITVPLDSIPEPAAENPTEPREEETRLLAKVAALPEKYRVPLTLHYAGNMKYREIGRTIGISDITARSRVHRARAMLKAMMDSDAGT